MLFQAGILKEIGLSLKRRGETVAVAESVTSGFLQLALSQIPDASLVFKGGITAYTAEEKIRLLNVEAGVVRETDAVSTEVAFQMATGVGRLFNADWSIATTGYATPVPDSDNKCFVFFCVCYRNAVMLTQKISLASSRRQVDVQHYYAEKILQEWQRYLE